MSIGKAPPKDVTKGGEKDQLLATVVEEDSLQESDDSKCCKRRIECYFIGSLVMQIGQASMAVAMPLIMMLVTKSTTIGAGSVTIAAACATAGQAAIVPLMTRMDLRIMLLLCMVFKTLIVLTMTFLYEEETGGWVATSMLVLFCFDSFMRGGIDTLRNVLPMLYCGKEYDKLKEFNSKFQVAYQSAVVIGPTLVGVMMTVGPVYCCYLISCVYFFSFCLFGLMPGVSYESAQVQKVTLLAYGICLHSQTHICAFLQLIA